MRVTPTLLDEAAARGVLSRDQSAALWSFLLERERSSGAEAPRFKAAHILYYLGGLIAIGAMTLFMTLGWERFGGAGLLLIATGYALAMLALTEFLLARHRLALPAGITAALAVALVPLAVYGLQHMLGLWPPGHEVTASSYRNYHVYIDWRWMAMELATLGAASVALWRYRLPFVVMPLAVTLWYVSMDLTPLLFGGDEADPFSIQRKLVSVGFGIGMLLVAFWVDVRSRHTRDFAFWLYVFGVMTFWGGLSSMDSKSELGKLAYCGVNLLMIALGAALSRRVFAIFGGIGITLYLGHLSYHVFKDSMLFPVALSAIGLMFVGAGVLWQRHEHSLGMRLRSLLPAPLRELVEQRAAH